MSSVKPPHHLLPYPQPAIESASDIIHRLRTLCFHPLSCTQEAFWNQLIIHPEWNSLPATGSTSIEEDSSFAHVVLLLVRIWKQNPEFAKSIIPALTTHPQWTHIPPTGYAGLVGIAATAALHGLIEPFELLTSHPNWHQIPGDVPEIPSPSMDIYRMSSPPITQDPTNTNYGSLILIAYCAIASSENRHPPHLEGHGIIPILKKHPHWPQQRLPESQELLNTAYRQWISYGHSGPLSDLPQWS